MGVLHGCSKQADRREAHSNNNEAHSQLCVSRSAPMMPCLSVVSSRARVRDDVIAVPLGHDPALRGSPCSVVGDPCAYALNNTYIHTYGGCDMRDRDLRGPTVHPHFEVLTVEAVAESPIMSFPQVALSFPVSTSSLGRHDRGLSATASTRVNTSRKCGGVGPRKSLSEISHQSVS